MPELARIGDIGVGYCCAHNGCIQMSGVIVTGAATIIGEGSNAARIGDIVVGNCGHTGTIVTGSSSVIGEGSGLARIGDRFQGTFSGTIVTGAASIEIGD